MSSARQIVLDASVGVKWFRGEPGSDEALELLRAHGRGEVTLVVPSLFVYEIVAVATRRLSATHAQVFWQRFMSWRLSVVEVGGELVDQTLVVRAATWLQLLRCSRAQRCQLSSAPSFARRIAGPTVNGPMRCCWGRALRPTRRHCLRTQARRMTRVNVAYDGGARIVRKASLVARQAQFFRGEL